MKRIFHLLFFLVCIPLFPAVAQDSPRPCANPDVYRNNRLAPFSAGGKQFEEWIAAVEAEETNKAVQDNDELYTLPVVVHVLHSGEPVGTGKNLSDERIQSQITVLNNDYGRISGTPGFNTHPAGADTRIRFCLATTDPNGNPTNGIVRVNTNRSGFVFLTDNSLLKNLSFWNPDKYLNIWVCEILGNQYIGYAQYPIIPSFWADSLPMIQPIPDVQPDGVVIDHRVFGNVPAGQGGPFPSYNRGRTATHEVGHYLGLLHIWGDGTFCSDNATDYCSDTPPQATYTSGCPATIPQSCTPGVPVMRENYLDYTNDVCMNIFTVEQKKRMRIVLRNCIRRRTLLQAPTSCGIADTQDQPDVRKTILIRHRVESDAILVDAPEDGRTIREVHLFTRDGKEVYVPVGMDAVQVRVSTSTLPAGFYFLTVRLSDGSHKTLQVATWKSK